MLFNTKMFIFIFLPVALAGYFGCVRFGRQPTKLWLLGCSLIFYTCWVPAFVLLLLTSIAANFCFGHAINITRRRVWLVMGVSFNLCLLGYFKYSNFFISLFGARSPSEAILLPLGISFFTFQQVMYLVDVSQRDLQPPPLLDFACFIAFFPHLMSGPIVRPADLLPQLSDLNPAVNWKQNLTDGMEIFLLGLAKKMVLADGLARFADPGFAAAVHAPITLLEAWIALLAYALQIYFDFSGYSDMAIGLARMFGIRFPLNFKSPYQAVNISDFWRRWNMTLSMFLREYLYIPLGGSRRGEVRRIINVMVTMILGGLWHGAAVRFVFWGALHGVYLIVYGVWTRLGIRLPRILSRSLTLLCVLLAWVPFRSANFSATVTFYRGLFGYNGVAIPAIYIRFIPVLGYLGRQVPVLPYLGDARTLSLSQATLFISVGWIIALLLPELHSMGRLKRSMALSASFAFTLQGLLFAPNTVPFLYFQF